jgi:hypothetical protein
MLRELKVTFRDFRLSPRNDAGVRAIKEIEINTKPLYKKVKKSHEFKLERQA